jgi:hypothetical protein
MKLIPALAFAFVAVNGTRAECYAFEIRKMGRRDRALDASWVNWDVVASQLSEVYVYLLGHVPRPDCVIT